FVALLAGLGPLLGLILLESDHLREQPLWRRPVFAVMATTAAAAVTFWLLGYGLVHGRSVGGLFGRAALAWFRDPPLAAAIETLLVADLAMVLGLLLYPIVEVASLAVLGVLYGGAIYPFVAHSVFNPDGLLHRFGFADGAGVLPLFGVTGLVAAFVIERAPDYLRNGTRVSPGFSQLIKMLLLLVALVAFVLPQGVDVWLQRPSVRVLIESLVATLATALLLGLAIRQLLLRDKRNLPRTLLVASLIALLASGLHLAAWRGIAVAILSTGGVVIAEPLLRRLRVGGESTPLAAMLAGTVAGVVGSALLFSSSEFVVPLPPLQLVVVQLSGLVVAALAATVPSALLMLVAAGTRSNGIYRDAPVRPEPLDLSSLNAQLDRVIDVGGRGLRLSADEAPELVEAIARINRLLDRMEFSLLRHETTISTLAAGIVTFSPARHCIITANPAFLRMLELSLERIVDQPMTTVLATTADGGGNAEELDALLASQVDSNRALELFGRRSDGSLLPIEATVSEAEVGGIELFYSVTVRSIRAQREREEALARHREQLNELITEQAVRLAEARDQAQQASLAKSHFLANMSHELRTPMNAIIGYSEMMIEDAQAQGYKELLPDLERVVTAGRHLLSLISDILDLSKIEVGKMEICVESFGLRALVNEVATTVEPLCARNRNRFELVFDDSIDTIRTDSTKLRQILFNLLSNASKFTEDGTIRLEVTSRLRHKRRFVRLVVSDDGIGMTSEQLGKVFDEFTQADTTTTRKYGGTGLGLALVRRFSHMLGGDIVAESEPDRGSRFTVHLPCELSIDRPLVESDPHLAAGGAGSVEDGALVLVIDGRSATRDWLQTNLTQAGHRVVTAWSGGEGLRLARILRPQVICVDPLISDIDGWGMIYETRRDPILESTEVMLLPIGDNHKRGHLFSTSTTLFKSVLAERLSHDDELDVDSWLLVTNDDAFADAIRSVASARTKPLVVTQSEGNAFAMLAERRESVGLILDLMMPNLESLKLMVRLVDDDRFDKIPTWHAIADQLDRVDRLRFQRALMKLLKLGGDRRERLLTQLLARLAAVALRERTEASGLRRVPPPTGDTSDTAGRS
ncbi:MAG: PAS domain S-box protein, partial [Myxococcales bacterium]|nr:PAS domain S-box protein [Myxococcales bacterium]